MPEIVLSFYWHVKRLTQENRTPPNIDNVDSNITSSKSYVLDASKQNFRPDNKINEKIINKSGQNLELRELRSELLDIIENMKNEMESKFVTKKKLFKIDSN